MGYSLYVYGMLIQDMKHNPLNASLLPWLPLVKKF